MEASNYFYGVILNGECIADYADKRDAIATSHMFYGAYVAVCHREVSGHNTFVEIVRPLDFTETF